MTASVFCISFASAGWEPKATDNSPLSGAVQAYVKGDHAAALKACQWHRTDAKVGPEARLIAGMCMMKTGNTAGALREWRSVRDSWPAAPEAATALRLEIENTSDATSRAKLEGLLLAGYAETPEAKTLLSARTKAAAAEKSVQAPESELEKLLAAGKREEAARFLMAASRRASGVERDRLLAQLASLYESTGDWRKAAGAWKRIAEEGNAEHREAATFDWIRTTAAIGRNSDLVEDMWKKYLRHYPTSPRGHLAVTRLAEMMVSKQQEDEAVALLGGWLSSAEGKSAGADFVSKRLSELRQKEESQKEGAISTFAKERLEAIAKLPAELESLCAQARTGKNTGRIINRIRDIRRGLVGGADAALMLQLDRTEALALNGQTEPRKALGLLDDAWSRNSKLPALKDAALQKAVAALSTDAIGISVEAGDHQSSVIWAERIAGLKPRGGDAAIALLKETALRLVLANAKAEGIAVLSILGDQVLARLPDGSRLKTRETDTVARLKALCAKGEPIPDNEWFVGNMPLRRDSRVARALFGADLLFAARETEKASRAYSEVILNAGLDKETEGYATLQMARCLAVIGQHEQALRTYRRFDTSLGDTKSAAPALLRAGTLCAGAMDDARCARSFFAMVSARYPDSPEAELADWYAATLLLWEDDLPAARTAYESFQGKYPSSAFLSALEKSIRPQLVKK